MEHRVRAVLDRASSIAGVVMPVDGGWAARIAAREPEPEEKKAPDELNVDAVFAKLKQIGGKSE